MKVKFYRCKICGKIVAMVNETAVPTICCGQEMYELLPNTTEGAFEKHIPVVSREGNVVTVKVGSVEHPMTPEHFIQ
jgi:superoxide reductase